MEKNEILLKKQTEFEIFLLSLKDAIKCTKQISDVNFTRENLNRVITDFNKIIAYKNIFSYHKKQTNEINLVSFTDINSLYLFNLYSYSVMFYSRNISNFEKCKSFKELYSYLKKVEQIEKKELKAKV